jgi:hypothetical protein
VSASGNTFESALRDAIARVDAALEELEVGDHRSAEAILLDLEMDLVAVLERGPAL